MTYGYDEATAVLGPLSPSPEPGALDLCTQHAHSVTVPHGWSMVRLVTEFEPAPPSNSDLMALANAIRETSKREVPAPDRAARDVRRRTDVKERPQLRAVPAPVSDVPVPGAEK